LLLEQEVRAAEPQVWLTSTPAAPWQTSPDLIRSARTEGDFVVEIDNDGAAQLRFGDGELGRQPPAAMSFRARYRIGNGTAGNVGAESISRLVLGKTKLAGVSVTVRNPLPAKGGLNPEPVAEAKLLAPRYFRKTIERAIIGADYEEIAERNPKVQNASAELVWTGSWYEADVAIDPLAQAPAEQTLIMQIEGDLHRVRRIGHDLHVERARYVPLDLKLEVCALPHHERGHIRAALLELFSNRTLSGKRRGYFHPDNLSFGEGIYLSSLVAAGQKTPGVECVTVTRLQRLFEPSRGELAAGFLGLRNYEIAQLENDPNHPERGKLEIVVRGGR
jgi:predicted phage baseplate assembly protein